MYNKKYRKKKKNKEALIMNNENINEEVTNEVTTEETVTVIDEIQNDQEISNVEENTVEETTDEQVENLEDTTEVVENTESEDLEETNDFRIGVVSARLLNVRKAPSKDGEIVGIVNQDDELHVTGEIDGYYSVESTNGTIGFCVKDYITIKE